MCIQDLDMNIFSICIKCCDSHSFKFAKKRIIMPDLERHLSSTLRCCGAVDCQLSSCLCQWASKKNTNARMAAFMHFSREFFAHTLWLNNLNWDECFNYYWAIPRIIFHNSAPFYLRFLIAVHFFFAHRRYLDSLEIALVRNIFQRALGSRSWYLRWMLQFLAHEHLTSTRRLLNHKKRSMKMLLVS